MIKPYYKKSNFKLYQGNSMEVLKDAPDNYFDMIFADPPYFLSSGSFTCQNGKMYWHDTVIDAQKLVQERMADLNIDLDLLLKDK